MQQQNQGDAVMLRRRVDWTRIVLEINGTGESVPRIAKLLRVDRTTVIKWRDCEREPSFNNGHNLLVLWNKKAGGNPLAPPIL